jgi:hypothetical protein
MTSRLLAAIAIRLRDVRDLTDFEVCKAWERVMRYTTCNWGLGRRLTQVHIAESVMSPISALRRAGTPWMIYLLTTTHDDF